MLPPWQAMLELSKEFPALHRPLIGERDQYMVSVLRTLAAECVARLSRRSHYSLFPAPPDPWPNMQPQTPHPARTPDPDRT